MNAGHIAEVALMVVAVNVAAMFFLAVVSYVGSVFALDWLEAFDRWLSARDTRRP